jgi:hypothetical protein
LTSTSATKKEFFKNRHLDSDGNGLILVESVEKSGDERSGETISGSDDGYDVFERINRIMLGGKGTYLPETGGVLERQRV